MDSGLLMVMVFALVFRYLFISAREKIKLTIFQFVYTRKAKNIDFLIN